jgi:uncharacterized protein (DUF1697 family)
MTVWAIFLRGINVGGNKPIKMAELRETAETLGLTGVRTMLQSGNLLASADETDPAALSGRLEAAIESRWSFHTDAIVRTLAQVRDSVDCNPFADRDGIDPRRLLVMFLVEAPAVAVSTDVDGVETEEMVLDGRELYLHYPDGMGRSKVTGARLERALGVRGTARNLNTLARLIDAAEDLQP